VLWNVFVDLERRLCGDEQRDLFAAIDALVPNSGCVGPNRSGVSEVYFSVDAENEADARARAADLISRVLSRAAIDTKHEISLQAKR
jgi:hypothetical protein